MNTTTASTKGGPSWIRLVAIQNSLIIRSGVWIELLGGLATLMLLSWGAAYSLLLTEQIRVNRVVETRFEALFLMGILLVALWPLMLWRDEAPRQRRYHWSLPVSRGLHDLSRVGAGVLWVLLVICLIALFGAFQDQTGSQWAVDGMTGRRYLFARYDTEWFWRYTALLLMIYTVVSVIAVAIHNPLRWTVAVMIGAGLLQWLAEVNDWHDLAGIGIVRVLTNWDSSRGYEAVILWAAIALVSMLVLTYSRQER